VLSAAKLNDTQYLNTPNFVNVHHVRMGLRAAGKPGTTAAARKNMLRTQCYKRKTQAKLPVAAMLASLVKPADLGKYVFGKPVAAHIPVPAQLVYFRFRVLHTRNWSEAFIEPFSNGNGGIWRSSTCNPKRRPVLSTDLLKSTFLDLLMYV
jgi:hypothetical protein